MEQTAIEQIRSAEKQGERCLINAETESKEILRVAQNDAADRISLGEKNTKEQLQANRKEAHAKGDSIIAQALQEAKSEIAALHSVAAARQATAVDLILSMME